MSKLALVKYRFLGKQGGLEKQSFKIIDELLKMGHEVTLVSSQKIDYKSIRSVQLKSYRPKGFLTLLRFNSRVNRWFKNRDFDAILALDRTSHHTHIRAGNGVHASYLDLRREKVGFLKRLSFMLNPLHFTLLFLEKKGFLASNLKKIFVNSELVRNQILSAYPVSKEKIEVIHNGVNWHEKTEAFDKWPETKARLMEELHLNPQYRTCVFIGHDFERKGLEHILKALPHAPYTQLLVIGHDKKHLRFKELTRKLGIANRVLFLDTFTDVTPFYALADALILPTLYDPFANVTLEALSMGVPVYTSSTNGASEVISPISGKTFDITIATQALISILQTLEPKTDSLANQIRQSVEHLDYSKQLSRFIESLCKA